MNTNVVVRGDCEAVPEVGAEGEPCTAMVIRPTRVSGQVFEGPSPNFPVIETLPEGDPIVILERSEDFAWWHIISEEFGVEGWMPEASLELSGACEGVPAIPTG